MPTTRRHDSTTEERTPHFITEAHLGASATVEQASQLIKLLRGRGWSVTYGPGPEWHFDDEQARERFQGAFDNALREVLEDGERTEHDAHEIETDALDPNEPLAARRAYIERVGVKLVELTSAGYDKYHGPAVAFINEYHEKRIRKVSREWFAIVAKGAPNTAMFAAVVDETVIGVAAALDCGKTSGFTVVHPDYRQMGIGAKLAAAKIARTVTYTTRVAIDNEPCLHLMFRSGLIATSIAVSDTNGKHVIRFETPKPSPAVPLPGARVVPTVPLDGLHYFDACPCGRDHRAELAEAGMTVPPAPVAPKVAKVKPTERRDGKPAEWAIFSWIPIAEVKTSDQLLVQRVITLATDDLPKGAILVPMGRNNKTLSAKHVLPGGLHLYREDAREAKAAWLAKHKDKVRKVTMAELWGYDGDPHDRY